MCNKTDLDVEKITDPDPIDTATRSQIPDGCDIRREILIETLSLDKPGGIIIYMNWGI